MAQGLGVETAAWRRPCWGLLGPHVTAAGPPPPPQALHTHHRPRARWACEGQGWAEKLLSLQVGTEAGGLGLSVWIRSAQIGQTGNAARELPCSAERASEASPEPSFESILRNLRILAVGTCAHQLPRGCRPEAQGGLSRQRREGTTGVRGRAGPVPKSSLGLSPPLPGPAAPAPARESLFKPRVCLRESSGSGGGGAEGTARPGLPGAAGSRWLNLGGWGRGAGDLSGVSGPGAEG